MKIRYKKGFKYQLSEYYSAMLPFTPDQYVETKYITLTTSGELQIRVGYAWDGPSGPTIDTKNFMRGSLEHDALYQLMRMGLLGKQNRKNADDRLIAVCKEDGMSWLRAQWVLLGVRFGGGASADPANAKEVLEAP
jgi:hypothetical protein